MNIPLKSGRMNFLSGAHDTFSRTDHMLGIKQAIAHAQLFDLSGATPVGTFKLDDRHIGAAVVAAQVEVDQRIGWAFISEMTSSFLGDSSSR